MDELDRIVLRDLRNERDTLRRERDEARAALRDVALQRCLPSGELCWCPSAVAAHLIPEHHRGACRRARAALGETRDG